MRAALIVMDVQKGFLRISPEITRSLRDAISEINLAINLFRKKEFPVVCIQTVAEDMDVVPGEEGFEISGELDILGTDLHIIKNHSNAFRETKLAEELRKQKVDVLIFTGFRAEFCVLSTYRSALDHDFKPILLRGAIASKEQSAISFVESISDIISLDALEFLWD